MKIEKRVRSACNEILDTLMPGFIALILLLAVAFVAMEVHLALNPPSHEGERIIMTWGNIDIWGNDPR